MPVAIALRPPSWTLIAVGSVVALYSVAVVTLALVGRRTEARALAGFVPDCVILFRRLLGDPRIPRGHKLLLAALVAYLAMPVDLVPDFIPVAGQLDDAILVALELRSVLRARGPALVREHWPGPKSSLKSYSGSPTEQRGRRSSVRPARAARSRAPTTPAGSGLSSPSADRARGWCRCWRAFTSRCGPRPCSPAGAT